MERRFKQCELNKIAADGILRMVGWIPERIAVAGVTVRLKDGETGEWTEGWTVVHAGTLALPAKVVDRQSRDHLRTRAASDI